MQNPGGGGFGFAYRGFAFGEGSGLGKTAKRSLPGRRPAEGIRPNTSRHCRRSASSRSARMRSISAAIAAGSRQRRRMIRRSAGYAGVRLDGCWLGSRDPVDPTAIDLFGGNLEPELLAHHAGKEPPPPMRLPARDSMMVAIGGPFGRRSNPAPAPAWNSLASSDEQHSCEWQPWIGFWRRSAP
jgi:hypothetical protein